MKKVILTKGLPASGKTTWAKSVVDKYPNQYKRVNKDDLRAMLDTGNHSSDREKFVLKVRDQLILLALEEGNHVIVDDTNLAPKHEERIKQLVKGKAEVEIKEFFDVSLEECIKRDLKRQNSVGEKVIRQMYNQFLKPAVELPVYNPNLPEAIICDLDGTLCDLRGRNPYDASTADQDGVNMPVFEILTKFEFQQIYILFVSGRKEQYRQPSLTFINHHFSNSSWLNRFQLFMRADDDDRKDSIVKAEIYEKHIKDKYNVKFVLDDRNQVVEMWRSLGLTCLQVAEGDF